MKVFIGYERNTFAYGGNKTEKTPPLRLTHQ